MMESGGTPLTQCRSLALVLFKLASDTLGLAMLRGLRDWEQRSGSSEVWVGARRYRAGEGAKLGEMGYTGAEDEGIWLGMVRGDWEGEEAVKEDPPPPPRPPRPNHHHPVTKTGDKKSSRWHFESDDSSDGAPPPPPPPPATRNTPPKPAPGGTTLIQCLPLVLVLFKLASDTLGLAILRGLRDWEQRRVCSEVWVGARRYRAREQARSGEMGYTGAEDEGIWVGMVGGD